MIAGRIRECLKILRWRETDLAEASGYPLADVRLWLDGRACPPLAVQAWLEALAKAHLSVPSLHDPGPGTARPAHRQDDAREQLPFKLVA